MCSTKRITSKTFYLFFLLLLLITPFGVSAHGLGASIEQEINGILVDVGHAPDVIIAGEFIRFDFSIFDMVNDPEEKKDLAFEDVWVRIEQGREVFFAGGISRASFGLTGFSYVFPHAGDYTMFLRFQNEDSTIVEVEISVPVLEGNASSEETFFTTSSLIMLLGGAGVGFLFGALFVLFRSRKG